MKQLPLLEGLRERRVMSVFDHFPWFISPHVWTTVATDSGTATVGDAAGGVLTLAPSDGTVADNDEIYVKTTNELFLFGADDPLRFEAKVKWAEANTDDANVMVGFASAVAANTIQDNGAGPPADYSGAVLYKVDGGTTWNFETSIGTSQTTTATQHTAGGSAWQVVRIEVREQGGVMEAVPFIDGQQMLDTNGRPIKHTFSPTSATEMNAFIAAKNGGSNNESVQFDYVSADILVA